MLIAAGLLIGADALREPVGGRTTAWVEELLLQISRWVLGALRVRPGAITRGAAPARRGSVSMVISDPPF
jgi:hypothetical protein